MSFLRGRLGEIRTAEEYVAKFGHVFGLTGSETFEVTRTEVDRAGMVHVFLQEYIYGIEVDGGEMAVHFNPETRNVFALSLSLLPNDPSASYNDYHPETLVNAYEAVSAHLRARDLMYVKEPELVYLLHEGEGFIAHRAVVEYTEAGQQHATRFNAFYSAVTGEPIVAFPLFFPALERSVYDMQNSDNQTKLPGTLVRSEGEPQSGDPEVDNAYTNAGVCYDFYMKKFDRDSFDNKGSEMISSVHFGVDYNNAFWTGDQMVYGDGDGITFANFSSDLSVVCHELTHAVVQYTAGLRYWKESGALNEAFADMMGASADIFHHGDCIWAQQWQIGYETYLAGPALRFMNNPRLDGRSYDYYPERYMGFQDVGGVHSNSGIGNLAYVLAAQGGVHPRQKTSNWVQGIGLEAAEQVFYSALSNYMMRTTNFEGARIATETAANVLYNSDVEYSISNAWYAVGVGQEPAAPRSR